MRDAFQFFLVSNGPLCRGTVDKELSLLYGKKWLAFKPLIDTGSAMQPLFSILRTSVLNKLYISQPLPLSRTIVHPKNRKVVEEDIAMKPKAIKMLTIFS